MKALGMLHKRNVSNGPDERITTNAIVDNHLVYNMNKHDYTHTHADSHIPSHAITTTTTTSNNTNMFLSNDTIVNSSTSLPATTTTTATSDDILITGNESFSGNLTATISSIRSNVTRVLDMYFKNVTDEFGYGAATTTTSTTPPPATTSTTTTTTLIKDLGNDLGNENEPVVATTTDMTNVNYFATKANSFKEIAADFVESTARTFAKNLTKGLTTTTTTGTDIDAGSGTGTGATLTDLLESTDIGAPSTPTFAFNTTQNVLTTAPSITYPTYPLPVRTYQNCSDLFANYLQPQEGIFCNWTWDQYLCWPPTPAGVLARMHCPAGFHGIDTRKFANRKCELDGRWGGKPNQTYNPIGWTDYQPCFKPEVNELIQMKHLDLVLEIANRTRTLEIVGLVLSLLALIVSLIIFCNFRSLRNNRTKIHKNLFIAMVLQVLVRLCLYFDQAIRKSKQADTINTSLPGIENTPYLCEASYVLLEYARTAMFMWMFIEGLYLHNMVTVAVFQGRFPHTTFSLIGWGIPVGMTTIWAFCTAEFMDSDHDCWWNYNLTPIYWILEGPRLIVILLNFFFLINIIRVLVVKLRQSQASDIEQTRKAVRAAIVLLPLLGITNLLHLVPDLNTPWKFALWSYVTHFLTSFQGFFIALIYCFLNGEVRAVLLKSLAVYMSVRGHPEWAPKRASMYSAAYNTAHDTEAQADARRNESPPNKRNGRKPSTTTVLMPSNLDSKSFKSKRLSLSTSPNGDRKRQSTANHHLHPQQNNHQLQLSSHLNNNNSNNSESSRQTSLLHIRRNSGSHGSHRSTNSSNGQIRNSSSWMVTLCFRGQKVLRVPTASSVPPESVIFELSEQ